MPWKSGRTTSFGVKRQRNADGELGERGERRKSFFVLFHARDCNLCF